MRLLFATVVSFMPLAAQAMATDVAAGHRLLMEGRVAEAISNLHQVVASNPNEGEAHLLLCRAYYAEGLPDPAVTECEATLTVLSNSSVAQDWMGKAYGLKADRSGPLTGYKLAKKVKAAFETAVDLDSRNADAVDDLGDYYLQAPALVGGGTDKAAALASRVEAQLPQRALRLRAAVAEKNKDNGTAEREFRALVETSGGRPDAWLDLGTYYERQHELDKAVDALRHAIAADRNKGAVLVIIAEALHRMGREPALATRAVQDYLSGGNWDDTAPTFKAHTLLGKLLAARGDKAAAKIEWNKALALAPDYEPARKALAAL